MKAIDSSNLLARGRGPLAIEQAFAIARGEIFDPEARAITSNGSGVNSSGTLVQALIEGGRLLPKCTIHRVAASSTVVPVLTVAPALPVGTNEGATGTSSDSAATFAGQSMALRPYYCTLEISRGAFQSEGGFNETHFLAVAKRAFLGAIDKGICIGTGSSPNSFTGIFVAAAAADGIPTGSDVACGASGAPKISDLSNIAYQLLAKGADPETSALVIAPALLRGALADTTSGSEAFRNELALSGTIMGIPAIPSGHAPTTVTAGSYVAVALDLAQYSVAIALDLQVDIIKVVGSDSVTIQAVSYLAGRPNIGAQALRLKTV